MKKTGCVQVDQADCVGYIIKRNVMQKDVVHPAYLYEGKWWDVIVVSSRYQVFSPQELEHGVPVWKTAEDARTGLLALAIER